LIVVFFTQGSRTWGNYLQYIGVNFCSGYWGGNIIYGLEFLVHHDMFNICRVWGVFLSRGGAIMLFFFHAILIWSLLFTSYKSTYRLYAYMGSFILDEQISTIRIFLLIFFFFFMLEIFGLILKETDRENGRRKKTWCGWVEADGKKICHLNVHYFFNKKNIIDGRSLQTANQIPIELF